MKEPTNFNTGATKKANPLESAINSNFVAEKREPVPARTPVAPAPVAAAPDTKEPEKKPAPRKKTEQLLVTFSEGERQLYKVFCAEQGVSMNHFVLCAMDFFKEEMEAERVSITKHGYKKLES